MGHWNSHQGTHQRAACAALFALAAIVGTADEAENPWEHTAAAGLGYSSGNSDSLTYHLRYLGTYRDDIRDAYFGADYYYAEYDGFTTKDSLSVFGSYNHLLTEKFYLGFGTRLLTDETSLLDYRVDLNPVIGYYFKRDDKGLFSIELGPGYAFESKDGESESFSTMRLAQHFDYRWSDTTRIRQSASLTPRVDDPASYIFEFSAGLDFRIRENWDIQQRIVHRVDLSPAFGQEKSDTLLTFGLSYSLNGFLKEEAERPDKRKTLKKAPLKKEGNRKGWVRNASIAASSTFGNSDTINFLLNYESIFRSDEYDFSFKGDYRFSESNKSTTDNRLNLSSSYSWKFPGDVYAGVGAKFSYDDSIDLSYRIVPGIHAGKYVILTDYGGLSFEAGLGYTFQEKGGEVSERPSFNAAQRLYWQLGYHTYLTQEFAYQGFVEDPGDFNLSSYLYVDTYLTDDLSWRIGAQYFYDSRAPEGTEKTDVTFLSGVAVRF